MVNSCPVKYSLAPRGLSCSTFNSYAVVVVVVVVDVVCRILCLVPIHDVALFILSIINLKARFSVRYVILSRHLDVIC